MSLFDESQGEAWRQRFGQEAPDGLPDLGRFLNHRSVREFSDETVSEATVKGLIGAAQSAATSSNLQLWSVVSVQDPERRSQIASLCADQKQVHNAPWFFAFLADHYRLRTLANRVGEEALGLDYNEFFTMAVIDACLAAERMVCAAETIGLGICYIGALRNDPAGVKEFLRLPEAVVGLFGLCLGWPGEGIKAEIKPRLRSDAVWFKEEYDPNPDSAEYDERMSEFYTSNHMNANATWTMRSGRRVDEHHLTGRERLKQFLEDQGFDKR